MNIEDRTAIQGVFSRIEEVARRGAPRDPEADAYIQARIDAQPGVAYYLAQTVLMQEQALKAAEAHMRAGNSNATGVSGPGRLDESGGYFGRTPPGSVMRQAANTMAPSQVPAAPGRGGGFLAGAAQTAMGVAGGMLLGNMLGGLFGGHKDAAAEAAKPDALADSSADKETAAGDADSTDSHAAANDGNDTWDWGSGNKEQVASVDDTQSDDFGSGFFDDGGGDVDEV